MCEYNDHYRPYVSRPSGSKISGRLAFHMSKFLLFHFCQKRLLLGGYSPIPLLCKCMTQSDPILHVQKNGLTFQYRPVFRLFLAFAFIALLVCLDNMLGVNQRAVLVVSKRNVTKKFKNWTQLCQILSQAKMCPIKEKQKQTTLLILWPSLIPYSQLQECIVTVLLLTSTPLG